MIPVRREDSNPPNAFRTGPRFFHVLRAVRDSTTLSPTERLVLVMLAGRAGDGRDPCPGIARLAADTGLTTRTIERTIGRLAALGWLSWRSASSRYGTNVYEIHPPMLRVVQPPEDVEPPPSEARPRYLTEAAPQPAQTIGAQPSQDRASTDQRSDDLPDDPRDPVSEPTGRPELRVVVTLPPAESTQPGGVLDVLRGEDAEPWATPGDAAAVLAMLEGRQELRRVAAPAFAARLADAARRARIPLDATLRALGELEEHAGDAAATGARWPLDLLRRRARSYVTRATALPRKSPEEVQEPRAKRLRPPEPTPPPDLAASVPSLRALLGTLEAARRDRPD